MYFWGNENIFAWPLLAVCGLRLSALLVRGHTSQEVAAGERKRRKKKKGLCRPGEERKENSNQKQSKEHTEKSEECEKNLFLKTTFFAEKYSCEKVWRINENEWRQHPIVGRKRFFIQEREEETWDESLKRENKVILVQITRTSPRRILSWKVEWGANSGGENYVTTWGQRERAKWSEVVVYKSHNSYISNIQQMLPLSWAGWSKNIPTGGEVKGEEMFCVKGRCINTPQNFETFQQKEEGMEKKKRFYVTAWRVPTVVVVYKSHLSRQAHNQSATLVSPTKKEGHETGIQWYNHLKHLQSSRKIVINAWYPFYISQNKISRNITRTWQ